MHTLIFGVLLTASVAFAGDVAFSTCPSANKAQISRISISGCPDGATECTFVKGQNYTFEAEGTNNGGEPINALYYKYTTVFIGLPITLAEGDACQMVTARNECPINDGATILWQVEEQVATTTPSLTSTITARIWGNEEGTNAEAWACVFIRVRIVNAAFLEGFNRKFQTLN